MRFDIKPRFVTFDMNGTLIHFRINDAIRATLGSRLPDELADNFLLACKVYRVDECLGEYQSFLEVVGSSLARAAHRFGIEVHEGDAKDVYDQIPTWGPYPGVTDALNRLAASHPLVIVTNSDNAHAAQLVENLRAPFHTVITAEEMGVYKPRLRAFESMLDRLGVAPHEVVHVSASPTYDLRPAAAMRIRHKVYMDRGFEHDESWLGYERITDIADLPVILGCDRA